MQADAVHPVCDQEANALAANVYCCIVGDNVTRCVMLTMFFNDTAKQSKTYMALLLYTKWVTCCDMGKNVLTLFSSLYNQFERYPSYHVQIAS